MAGTEPRDSSTEHWAKHPAPWIAAAAVIIAALIGGLFQLLARPTPTPTPTTTSDLTTRRAPKVEITSPREGDSVPMAIEVRGDASSVPEGQEIWIFVRTEQPAVTYHPQTGAASIQSDGHWTSPEILIGVPEDAGRKYQFDIVAVLAGPTARQTIGLYFDVADRTGSYPGFPALPRHTVELDRIGVVRE